MQFNAFGCQWEDGKVSYEKFVLQQVSHKQIVPDKPSTAILPGKTWILPFLRNARHLTVAHALLIPMKSSLSLEDWLKSGLMGVNSELLDIWNMAFIKDDTACIRIRTRGEMYSQIYPSAWRSSRGRSPRELLKGEGYIWPYIPSRVLTRTLYFLIIIRQMLTLLFSLTISPYTP